MSYLIKFLQFLPHIEIHWHVQYMYMKTYIVYIYICVYVICICISSILHLCIHIYTSIYMYVYIYIYIYMHMYICIYVEVRACQSHCGIRGIRFTFLLFICCCERDMIDSSVTCLIPVWHDQLKWVHGLFDFSSASLKHQQNTLSFLPLFRFF